MDEFDTLPVGEYTINITGNAGDYYSYNYCINVNISYKVKIIHNPDTNDDYKYVFKNIVSYPVKTVYIEGEEDLDLTGLKFIGKNVANENETKEYNAEDCFDNLTYFDFYEDKNGSYVKGLHKDLIELKTYSAGNYTIRIRGKSGSMESCYNCHDVDIIFKITIIEADSYTETTGSYLPGDANCDGKVTIADSVAVLQHLANKDRYGLSILGSNNADCFAIGDGVTANDALAIQRFDAKALSDLPIFEESVF